MARTGKVMVGDKILAVNDKSLLNMAHKDVIELLRDSGPTPSLRVRREDDVAEFLESQAYAAYAEKKAASQPLTPVTPAGPTSTANGGAMSELLNRGREGMSSAGQSCCWEGAKRETPIWAVPFRTGM